MKNHSRSWSTTRVTPTHIVIFEDRCDKNESTFFDRLCLKGNDYREVRSTCIQYDSKASGLFSPRFYRRFSAGLVDEEGANKFMGNSGVLVLRNQKRQVPKMLRDPIEPLSSVRATDSGGGPVVPPAQVNLNWHLNKVGVAQPPPPGSRIKVAVLDSGIDLNHPDFKDKFIEMVPDDLRDRINIGEIGSGNAVNYVADESLQDENGHGTHCAGLIAGPLVPKSGLRYGVAPNADLLVAKVLNRFKTGSDDNVIEAIDWAADQGARIVSLSLGSPRAQRGEFDPLYEAVASALLEQGVLIIAAAGNESQRDNGLVGAVINPAACPSIVAVAAVKQDDSVAPDSSGGVDDIGEVNIAAPGVDIYSAWSQHQYRLASGTSSAAPIVAGVAALLLEQNPNLTARQLRDQLINSALPLGSQQDFGAGMVQLEGT